MYNILSNQLHVIGKQAIVRNAAGLFGMIDDLLINYQSKHLSQRKIASLNSYDCAATSRQICLFGNIIHIGLPLIMCKL